jgi:hypothetical protein
MIGWFGCAGWFTGYAGWFTGYAGWFTGWFGYGACSSTSMTPSTEIINIWKHYVWAVGLDSPPVR